MKILIFMIFLFISAFMTFALEYSTGDFNEHTEDNDGTSAVEKKDEYLIATDTFTPTRYFAEGVEPYYDEPPAVEKNTIPEKKQKTASSEKSSVSDAELAMLQAELDRLKSENRTSSASSKYPDFVKRILAIKSDVEDISDTLEKRK